jgi:hypothetical protein
MRTLVLISILPLFYSLHAQKGPQDNWYITDRVAMPSGCSPHDPLVTPDGNILLISTGNDKIHELQADGTLIVKVDQGMGLRGDRVRIDGLISGPTASAKKHPCRISRPSGTTWHPRCRRVQLGSSVSLHKIQ